ncbi:macro domain-containing protein [Actinomycetes bacterium KLBMP 9759]
MIRSGEGDLLRANVDALVNTVNTVGAAGRGIALQFRKAYPENFAEYSAAARDDAVLLGRMHVHATGLDRPRFIINFPTKRHWRAASRLPDIANGLQDLVATIRRLDITSIAVPALGCGLGGLRWTDVRPLILDALGGLDVDVVVYEPAEPHR